MSVRPVGLAYASVSLKTWNLKCLDKVIPFRPSHLEVAMSPSTDPAASLQAKLGNFLQKLEPDELELFAFVVKRALDGEVEMFASQLPQTPATPPGVPIPYPNASLVSSSFARVLNSVGKPFDPSVRTQP